MAGTLWRRAFAPGDFGRDCAGCRLPMIAAAGVTARTHPSCDPSWPLLPGARCTSSDDVQPAPVRLCDDVQLPGLAGAA